MAATVKKTDDVVIGNPVQDAPEVGAYSPAIGSSLSQSIDKKTPYALLEKTGQLPTHASNDATYNNVRWLRELGISSATTADYERAWETDDAKHRKSEHEWRDSYGGRVTIRAGTRGVIGAAGFAWAQHATGRYLENYAFSHDNPAINSKVTNGLEFAARAVDLTLGKALYKIAYKFHKGDVAKATEFVSFRPTNAWKEYGLHPDGEARRGRSFGHEGIGITFDFGVMSFTDYLGREAASLLDPNSDKKWMKDGHIDVKEATKAFGKSMWIGITKSMGEDYFAMAAGYPYLVKWSRNKLDKYSPGFGYDSDRWANGGSFKVDDHGKINGNYQLEGMTDLAFRFTGYNIYTKIFRDGYDKAASNLHQFWNGDRKIHLPHLEETPSPLNLAKKAVEGVGHALNYLARTIIKTTIIMIPSSSLFGFIRAAQSKDIGVAIHPEHGPVGVKREDGSFGAVFASGAVKKGGKRSAFPLNENTEYYFEKKMDKPIDFGTTNGAKNIFAFAPDKRNGYEQRFDFFGQNDTWHDKFTNPVGRFCYQAGHTTTEAIKPAARFFGFKDSGDISKHVQRTVDAGLAYFPYFALKTDVLGFAYDNPKGDMAADRTTNGIVHLNLSESMKGAGELVHTILNQPFTDPDRQKLVEKKMRTHTNQIWSNQDEIYAKDREDEAQQRMEASLSLGKPMSMGDLYRKPFTERVGRRDAGLSGPVAANDSLADNAVMPKRATEDYKKVIIAPDAPAANESYFAQNVASLKGRTAEDYRKQDDTQQAKLQANGSWHDRVARDFGNNISTQGQTIN